MKLLSFLTLFLSIHVGTHAYLAFWLVRRFGSGPLSAWSVGGGFVLLAFAFPAVLALARRHETTLMHALAYGFLVWFGVSFLGVVWAVLSDGIDLVARSLGALDYGRAIARWGLLGVALVSAHSIWLAHRPPTVRRIDVPVRDLPADLEGLTIAQISDVHLGLTCFPWQFERLARLVRSLEPDLVVVTGDLIDPGSHPERSMELLRETLSPPAGVFGTLGNHELYMGEAEAARLFALGGIRLLREEVVRLPCGLQIAGIGDAATAGLSEADLAATLDGLDPGLPTVLLAHRPAMHELAGRRGVSLMLSGHTHAGQIFPFGLFTRLAFDRVSGMYRSGAMRHYVTAGSAYWGPPMRFLTRHEVPLFTLRREGD